jgi:molybdate transport system substrate-binding protein
MIARASLLLLLALGCRREQSVEPLRVAAAADLSLAFKDIAAAYENQTGQRVVVSFGSTGLLAKQIEEGAPFAVFAAANVSYADQVVNAGACVADSKALYARGRITLWTRRHATRPSALTDLATPRFTRIAIANPAHAPYGRAAEQALTRAGVLAAVKPKLVMGENIQQALQFAQTGNADAALVALSLSVKSDGEWTLIDETMHDPIDQALVACKQPGRDSEARAFIAFINSPRGRAIMKRYGFLLPGELHSPDGQ